MRETVGFYSTGEKTFPHSRTCPCCKGNPFRNCGDRRVFTADGAWLQAEVEKWIEHTDFRLALERNPSMKESEIGRLRYKSSRDFLSGIQFWAFSKTIYALKRNFEHVGDYERATGEQAAAQVLEFAVSWAKRRGTIPK